MQTMPVKVMIGTAFNELPVKAMLNVVLEGIRSFIIIIIGVHLSQLFAHGRTPIDLVSELPNNALIGISLFIIVLNVLVGIAMWYENEKRYERIHNDLNSS